MSDTEPKVTILTGRALVVSVIAQALPDWSADRDKALAFAEHLYAEIESIGYAAIPVPEIETMLDLIDRAQRCASLQLHQDIIDFERRNETKEIVYDLLAALTPTPEQSKEAK